MKRLAAIDLGRLAGRFASRALVSVLLPILVLGPLAATNHALTARHMICVQHSALVDVDDSDSNPSARTASTGSAMAIGSAPGEGTHQHCLFVSSRDKRDIECVSQPDSGASSSSAQAQEVRTSEAPKLALAIYSLAPKHSPPSA